MQTAIVTGANRGIGREVVRQLAHQGYRVILTSRDPNSGRQAAEAIIREIGSPTNGEVIYHPLDVTSADSVQQLHSFVVSRYQTASVLVNNAAVLLDRGGTALDVPVGLYEETFETNLIGPLRLCQAFIPLMLEHGYGRVVNVSSDSGQLANQVDHMPAYRISKLALNGLTRILANGLHGSNVLVNAVHPGWVRTDMGGNHATRSVEEGARGIIWLATLPDDGPQGGFFYDQQPQPW